MKTLKLAISLIIFAFLCYAFLRFGNSILNVILISSSLILTIELIFKKNNNY